MQWATGAFANADYNLPLLQMSPCFHSFFKSIIHHYSKIFFCLSKSFYFFFQKNSIGKSFERLGNKRRGVTCMTSTRTNNVDILYSGSRHGIIYARSFVSVRDNLIEFFLLSNYQPVLTISIYDCTRVTSFFLSMFP